MLAVRDIECIIEAVLFTAGDPVPLEKLCEICSVDKKTMRAVLENYSAHLENTPRGLMLRELETSWQLCTKPIYSEYVSLLGNVRKAQGLTQAAYEVLSIVAYKQPVTRAVIDRIRGVSSDGVLLKLQEKNLVTEAGRENSPGKPFLYETTEEFLRAFGFRSKKDLPKPELNVAEFQMGDLPLD